MPSQHLRGIFVLLCGIAGLTLAGCAGSASPAESGANDPLEGVNRKIFDFNLVVDHNVLKPVAIAYRDNLPDPVKNGIRNFLENLDTPEILLNDVLQGEFSRAHDTVGRFIINSSLGLGGFIDLAGDNGLAGHSADFGQTLGVWGVPPGPYLMVPVLGPFDLRDGIGYAGDALVDPLNRYTNGEGFEFVTYTRSGASGVDTRSRNIEALDRIESTSLDFYAEIRSMYLQRRQAIIRHEQPTGPEPGL